MSLFKLALVATYVHTLYLSSTEGVKPPPINISIKTLEHIFKYLSSNYEHESDPSTEQMEHGQCLEFKNICTNAGISVTDLSKKLTVEELNKICPSMLKNALNNGCRKEELSSSQTTIGSTFQKWLYTIFGNVLINLCAVNGFLLYKFLRQTMFKRCLVFLMSMAIGILCSSALLHLLPNSIEYDTIKHGFILFGFVIVGAYSFLVLEVTLKSFAIFSGINKAENPLIGCVHSLIPKNTQTEESSEESQIPNVVIVNSSSTAFYHPSFISSHVSSTAVLVLVGDAIHNCIDGVVIGSSFAQSIQRGFIITLAVIFEEFAHELGDFAALASSGMTPQQALFWNVIASLTNHIGGVIGLIAGTNQYFLSIIEAFCAGMFLYVGLVVMLPEVLEKTVELTRNSKKMYIITVFTNLLGILFGTGIMYVLARGQIILDKHFSV